MGLEKPAWLLPLLPSKTLGQGSSAPAPLPYANGQLGLPQDRPLGRDDLIHQAVSHLRPQGKFRTTSAVVVVWGEPGTGKTTLARWLAQFFGADYPDACLFAELRADVSDWAKGLILRRWLHQLGEPDPGINAALEDLTAVWQSCLQHRRVIVLLETLGPVEQWQPLLPQGSSCIAIVTNPSLPPALAEGLALETTSLPEDSAIALLASTADIPETMAMKQTWKAIAAYCHRLPLALQLVGHSLGHTASTADIMAEPMGNLPRQTSKSPAVAGSLSRLYQSLTPQAQSLLRRLSLLPAPLLNTTLAATLLSVDAHDALSSQADDKQSPAKALDELVSLHCLDLVGPDTYTFSHDLLRSFAKGCLAGDDPMTVRQQLRLGIGRWYADSLIYMGWAQHPSQSLEQNGQLNSAASGLAAWPEHHWPNLPVVWQWLTRSQDWSTLLRLGLGISSAALGAVDPAWWQQCQAQLSALDLASVDLVVHRAYTSNNIANHEAYQSNYGPATILYQQSLKHLQNCQDPVGQAHVLANLGAVYGRQQLGDQQVAAWQQAITILPPESSLCPSVYAWMQHTHRDVAQVLLRAAGALVTADTADGGFLNRWFKKLF
ncbi:MAG: AAA family ATPase [Nodosilinea sp.]